MGKMCDYVIELECRTGKSLDELEQDFMYSWEYANGKSFMDYCSNIVKPKSSPKPIAECETWWEPMEYPELNPSAVTEHMSSEEAINKLREVLLDRGKDYGTPRQNHGIVADLFNVFLSHHSRSENLEPEDTMVMMMLIKIARLCTTPEHVDSYLDIAGYAICALDAMKEKNSG